LNREPLVIEYLTDGPRRGYTYTSPTAAYAESTLKEIWRSAMPRGQGWGDESMVGARSIKCFPLEDGRAALADVAVTAQADEHGRRGIRRAQIEVLSARDWTPHVQARLDAYPDVVRSAAAERLGFCRRTDIIAKTLPRFHRDPRLVLLHPYTGPRRWQIMEAFVLMLALEPVGLMRRWGTMIPFNTLALDYREECRMVALPNNHAARVDIPSVTLP
jgi:hypothetical protein